MNECLICGEQITGNRATCSERCHEKFVFKCEEQFGVYKKVIDLETGNIYAVSTRTIIEKGIAQKDLHKFPLWEDEKHGRKN